MPKSMQTYLHYQYMYGKGSTASYNSEVRVNIPPQK